jgi:cytochrome c556
MRVGMRGVGAIIVLALLTEGGATATEGARLATPAARQAVEARKALFTLLSDNFKGLGEISKGAAPFDANEVQRRGLHVATLAEWAGEAFPDQSNIGEPDSKARPEIWRDRADFDRKLKDFQSHAAALRQVAASAQGLGEDLRQAVAVVAQDCKSCHDSFRLK